jgi:hypothetical protein
MTLSSLLRHCVAFILVSVNAKHMLGQTEVDVSLTRQGRTIDISEWLERLNVTGRSTIPKGTMIPLKQAFDGWRVPIMFDERGLEEEGLTIDEPVLAPLPTQSLSSYCETTLSPMRLGWYPIEDRIMIAPVTKSSNMIGVYKLNSTHRFDRIHGGQNSGAASLAMVIETLVSPDSWSSCGGDSRLFLITRNDENLLTVSAPIHVHLAIVSFLQSVNEVAMKERSSKSSEGSKQDPTATAKAKSRVTRVRKSRL